MTVEALQALWKQALADNLEDALASLYSALKRDTPWLSACGLAASTDRRDELLAILRSGGGATLDANDGLALLSALDEELFSQNCGSLPQVHSTTAPPGFVVPRPPDWSPPLAGGGDQLERWCRHHHVFPSVLNGVRLEVVVSPQSVMAAWGSRTHWMVAGFADGIAPRNDATEHASFHCATLDDPETRSTNAGDLVELVRSEQPLRALVVPELSLDPATRDVFLDTLLDLDEPPLFTVPGSFHVMEDGQRRNVALLVDGDGRTVTRQSKIQPINLPGKVTEHIVPGTSVALVLGPWGTLVVAICRDFMEFHQTAWATLAPDVVLVPSMGNGSTMRGHVRRAEDLNRCASATTLMANQPTADWNDDKEQMSPTYGLIQAKASLRWLREDSLTRVRCLIWDGTGPKRVEQD